MRFALLVKFYLIITCFVAYVILERDSCDAECNSVHCGVTEELRELPTKVFGLELKKKFLLYDVNPGEGFNLRRDVYMRVASLLHKYLKEHPLENWILVLPPWGPLYHWKSGAIGRQEKIPWAKFFDLRSLSKYIPVLDFDEYLEEYGEKIDIVYYLQHFPDLASGQWKELYEIGKCLEEPPYKKLNKKVYGWFWGYKQIYSETFKCVSVQGTSSTLKPLMLKTEMKSVMFDRAEVILHDSYGDADYWMIRRSMRYSHFLRDIGNEFRSMYLNSTDPMDKTEQPESWLLENVKDRSAVGGPYLAVHLRRQDFVRARPLQVPSIKHAADQIKEKLEHLKLKTVYLATDAPASEIDELKKYIPDVVQYRPDQKIHELVKDGGVAIIDQWICAHARYFIGTYESTFSFRIQEEREILGFPVYTTFNRLCGDNETSCAQPTEWKIVYP